MALYELAVIDSASAAMSVRVDPGVAFARGYHLEVYSSAKTLVITAAAPTNQRINRVVVRCDLAGHRACHAAGLSGEKSRVKWLRR